jgi:hypothetical protein
VSGGGEGQGVVLLAHRENEFLHSTARRPAQRAPHPQTLHSDPDLQIMQPCCVRGWGGAGGGAAGRTLKRKFGKLRLRAWPEPRSQRPGLKLGKQAENFVCRGIRVLVT